MPLGRHQWLFSPPHAQNEVAATVMAISEIACGVGDLCGQDLQ